MRTATIIFTTLLLFVISGCGSSKSAEAESTEPIQEQTTEAAESAEEAEGAYGESGTDEPAATTETAPGDVMPNDGTRQVGDITKCPVSGDVFTVAADSPKAEHDGGTYYLCCKGCIDKFEADPAKFLSAEADAPKAHEHGHHHGGHAH